MNLIQRSINRFKILYPLLKLPNTNINQNIESNLGIELPIDFKELSKFYDGNNAFNLDGALNFDRDKTPSNVIDITLEWRCFDPKLPNKYLVLATYDESFIILDTLLSIVLWLNYYDYESLCQNTKFTPYKTFGSFLNYFQFLLDEEEKMRAEDMK